MGYSARKNIIALGQRRLSASTVTVECDGQIASSLGDVTSRTFKKEKTIARHPDPVLEKRILSAAVSLWRHGGAEALTMRAVAHAAGTNTPSVYRRFKDRRGLLRAILMHHVDRVRNHLQHQQTAQEIAESYLEFALHHANEHRLFTEEAYLLRVPTGRVGPYPIGDCRPDFALSEQALATELGGVPEDHAHLALQICSILDGAAMMLLNKTLPDGYEKHLKDACRSGVSAIIEQAKKSRAMAAHG